MNMKRVVVSLSLFAMVFAIGCVVLADEFPVPSLLSDNPVIAFVGHSLSSESCQRNVKQFEIECEQRGWTARVEMAGGELGPQHDMLETLINAGVEAIILQYVHVQGLQDVIAQARDQGIGVYCLDTEPMPGIIVNATMPGGIAGAEMAYYGLNRLGNVGGVVYLSCRWHIVRRRAYAAQPIIDDFPNMESLATEWVSMEDYSGDSYNFMNDWLTRFGDDIKWVFGGWDTLGMFAAKAVLDRGYTADDIFCTGVDGGAEAFRLIRDPSEPFVATYAQPFELYCHTCMEVIDEIQVQGVAPHTADSMVPVSKVIYCKGALVTEANCPAPGASVHSLFDYYDPATTDAWYNWGDPYTI